LIEYNIIINSSAEKEKQTMFD